MSLKQDLARRVVAFAGPDGLSSAATAAWRIGGIVLLLGGVAVLALGVLERGPFRPVQAAG